MWSHVLTQVVGSKFAQPTVLLIPKTTVIVVGWNALGKLTVDAPAGIVTTAICGEVGTAVRVGRIAKLMVNPINAAAMIVSGGISLRRVVVFLSTSS